MSKLLEVIALYLFIWVTTFVVSTAVLYAVKCFGLI